MNNGTSLIFFGAGLAIGDFGASVVSIGGLMVVLTGIIIDYLERKDEHPKKRGKMK